MDAPGGKSDPCPRHASAMIVFQSDADDPVAAFLFAMIKGPIRGADETLGEILGIARRALDARDPKTRRDRHSRTAAAERLHGNRFAQFATDRYPVIQTRLRQDQGEFLAAEPRNPIRSTAQALQNTLRALLQHGVSRGMTVLVIDALEMIY